MDIISHCVNKKLNVVVVAARDILILFISHFDRMSCHYSLIQSWISFHAITRSDTRSHLLQATSRRSMEGPSAEFSVTKSVKRQWNNTVCDIKHMPLPYLQSSTENNVVVRPKQFTPTSYAITRHIKRSHIQLLLCKQGYFKIILPSSASYWS